MDVSWELDHFVIPPATFEKLNRAYPDFQFQLTKMEMWVLANPAKKKKNWFRFMVNWLNKQYKEKAVERKKVDDTEFNAKFNQMKEEAAPPPDEWKQMMERIKHGKAVPV